ncbi:unnamed protein product [Linum tenue]|uniref:Uncharacterized protein n=1 Tax=Linum tenue TaxID=586396 RepID=A0AAV0M6Q5_9ROSI|nr:unnamed protein product [Linum tenue]
MMQVRAVFFYLCTQKHVVFNKLVSRSFQPFSVWPSRKLEARIVVQRLEGLKKVDDPVEKIKKRLVVEVKWKGVKGIAWRTLRRNRVAGRNLTQKCVGFRGDGD